MRALPLVLPGGAPRSAARFFRHPLLSLFSFFRPSIRNDGKEYRVNTPLFMRNAERYARSSKRSARVDSPGMQHCVWLMRSGVDTTRSGSPDKYSGSPYYPEIAPFSPHFVGTTFSTSHTMMEASEQLGLIASSEARIVDPRRASNRLSETTQSVARRRTKRPQQKLTDNTREGASERFGRSAMSPATTGGWIANFVDAAQ
jgi:hypothetical protein